MSHPAGVHAAKSLARDMFNDLPFTVASIGLPVSSSCRLSAPTRHCIPASLPPVDACWTMQVSEGTSPTKRKNSLRSQSCTYLSGHAGLLCGLCPCSGRRESASWLVSPAAGRAGLLLRGHGSPWHAMGRGGGLIRHALLGRSATLDSILERFTSLPDTHSPECKFNGWCIA